MRPSRDVDPLLPSDAAAVPEADLRRLGEALRCRRDQVVSGMLARARGRGETLDEDSERRFERVGMVTTCALAARMAGDDGHAPSNQESWLIFGELAAQRALPLNEVIRRCLAWRDSAEEAVRDIAADLGVSSRVCSLAIAMIQRGLTLTLIQMGEAFESERRRSDEARSHREEELAFIATHDQLTGLPNRALILDRLQQMLIRARHTGTTVAALFIDLDDFKRVNDTLGHAAGDQLLQEVAGRFATVTRDVDALGRLAGDEFVLLAGDISPADRPERVAERLLEALGDPFVLGDSHTSVTITASIGIETGEQLTPGEILQDADVAMYRAKWAGKNRYFMFSRPPSVDGQEGEVGSDRRLAQVSKISWRALRCRPSRRASDQAIDRDGNKSSRAGASKSG